MTKTKKQPRRRTRRKLATAERLKAALLLVEELVKQNDALKAQASGQATDISALRTQVGLPVRHRLPDTRNGVTHKFSIAGHEGYLNVGTFADGTPGELFITMAKEGSTLGGLMDTIGKLTSLCLQYGVSVEVLSHKFAEQRFEPSGFTTDPDIKQAASIIDYVFRWIELHFGKKAPKA